MKPLEIRWPDGLKKTKTRVAVLQALAVADRPLTAVEIAARTGEKPVWLSTVYRVLDIFEQHGMVLKTPVMESGIAIYELAGGHRHYAVCLGCNRVITLENCPLENFLPRLSEQDFQVVGHRLQMYGYCTSCAIQKRGRAEVHFSHKKAAPPDGKNG